MKILSFVAGFIILVIVAALITGCGEHYSCQNNARYWGEYYSKTTKVRYGHGWYFYRSGKRAAHMWCEYLDSGTNRWLLARDTAQPHYGFPISCYPEYKVKRYEYI